MDRDSYRKMYNMPKPRDHKVANTLDKSEQLSLKNSKYRIDYRPRVFFRLMRIEVILLFFGIGLAVSKLNLNIGSPYYSKNLQNQGNSKPVKQINESDIQKEIQKTIKELDM